MTATPVSQQISLLRDPDDGTAVHRRLRSSFSRYGRLVGQQPIPFIVIPVLVACLLGVGLIRIETKSDIEHLFTPTNGKARDERKIVQELFPMNDTVEFSPLRLSTLGTYGRLIVEASGARMTSSKVIEELLRLDDFVRHNLTAKLDPNVTLAHICAAESPGKCYLDALVALIRQNRSQYESLDFTFPATAANIYLGRSISGPRNEAGRLQNVSALSITYWLRDSRLSDSWLKDFVEKINAYKSKIIKVLPFSSDSLEDELEANADAVFINFTIAFTLLITFSVTSLVMHDWVRTKTNLGMLGVLSPGLAILATFGLLSAAGVSFTNVVRFVPFLILGIGVDDMFILVAAYRRTSPRLTVPERMAETLADAGMSITITSITDFLAFGIGAITVFPAVFDFCMYASVAVLIDFLFQITFFAGWIALDARREAANRHAMAFQVVLPKTRSEAKSRAYRIFCSGGVKVDGDVIGEEEDHLASRLIRDWYGPFVTNRGVKIITLLLFCCYIVVSIYGVTQVNQGLELKNLVQDHSYARDFLDRDDRYFDAYGPQVQFVIDRPLEYWNVSVRSDLNRVIQRIIATDYVGSPPLVLSWLHDFEQYVLLPIGLANVTIPKRTFLQLLQRNFLQLQAFSKYALDINFSGNDDGEITSSRFFVQTNNLTNANLERHMTIDLRCIAEEERMIAYHPAFVFFDQYIAVLPNTLQNVGCALAAMLIVAVFILPYPYAALLITAAIASISIGVAGLMTFWAVNLDFISMISIIVCIGFSVDFSAHICYAYFTSVKYSRNEKIVDALYQLGYPIIQGAISTVLGLVPLAFSSSYLFRTFFKTLFLVITLGFFHGFVLLPVVLSLIGPMRSNTASRTKVADRVSAEEQQENQVKIKMDVAFVISNEGGVLKIEENEEMTSYLNKNSSSDEVASTPELIDMEKFEEMTQNPYPDEVADTLEKVSICSGNSENNIESDSDAETKILQC